MSNQEAEGAQPKAVKRKRRKPDVWDVPIEDQCLAKVKAGHVCRVKAVKGGRCQDHQGSPRCCAAQKKGANGDGGVGYCTQTALGVGGRCRLHGGLSPVGPSSPHYKDGRWSKHLPGGTVDRFNEANADKELQTIRRHLALADAMITGIMEKLKQGKNPTQAQSKEMREWMDTFRRLGDSEARRMTALQQNVTLAQFLGVMRVVADLIREFVTDPDQRRQAQQRLQKLLLAKDNTVVEGEIVEKAS